MTMRTGDDATANTRSDALNAGAGVVCRCAGLPSIANSMGYADVVRLMRPASDERDYVVERQVAGRDGLFADVAPVTITCEDSRVGNVLIRDAVGFRASRRMMFGASEGSVIPPSLCPLGIASRVDLGTMRFDVGTAAGAAVARWRGAAWSAGCVELIEGLDNVAPATAFQTRRVDCGHDGEPPTQVRRLGAGAVASSLGAA